MSVSLIDGHIDGITNYDRIRNMSVEEMAEFLRNFVTEALTNPKCIVVEKWLESEVDTE